MIVIVGFENCEDSSGSGCDGNWTKTMSGLLKSCGDRQTRKYLWQFQPGLQIKLLIHLL
jgi:hypothetical protein